MSEWQPIETAPKERVTIIVSGLMYGRGPGRWVVLAHWDKHRQRFVDREAGDPNSDLGTSLHEPTHWIPLPLPPSD